LAIPFHFNRGAIGEKLLPSFHQIFPLTLGGLSLNGVLFPKFSPFQVKGP